MREYAIQFDGCYTVHPQVKQGEALATIISIDCGPVLARWPEASFAIIARRADGQVYPALVMGKADGGILRYALTAADTAVPGRLLLEIQAHADGVLAKAWPYALEVVPALDDPGEVPTPQAATWLETVLDAAAEAALARDEAAAACAQVVAEVDAFTADELARQLAEAGRVQAEMDRRAGEMARTDAETARAAAEALRQDAEGVRVTRAEAVSQAEGGRVQAEKARTAAELARAQATQAAVAQAESAAQAATLAGQEALADGQAAVEMAAGAVADMLGTAASGWQFQQIGTAVTIRPVAGSTLWVKVKTPTTVTHGEDSYDATPDAPLEITASAGENTLTAAEGLLRVHYMRDSMDLLMALLAEAKDTGTEARLSGLVDGLPLKAAVHAVSRQEGEGEPSPENVRAIYPVGQVAGWHSNGESICPVSAKLPDGVHGLEGVPARVQLDTGAIVDGTGLLVLDGSEFWTKGSDTFVGYVSFYLYKSQYPVAQRGDTVQVCSHAPFRQWPLAAGNWWWNGPVTMGLQLDTAVLAAHGYESGLADAQKVACLKAYLQAEKAKGQPVMVLYEATEAREMQMERVPLIAMPGENTLKAVDGSLVTLAGKVGVAGVRA